ncbi:Kelch repeat-containing protein [Flavilitoribacter nigricans]|uniref:Galactose oxidase n=1 Tax=Flavilitoribacter nigricans (strain ATCC 23147 / DSM 23189 / NBRC 102662 / NCIMB 1420 / SS-2) TaxID=1122177 RepID=A0A2D0MXJ3_FLAN2|nr:kelch repeat-containing protein [Flavilitoribacter nigricans]PHN00890.1 hypothetical protein CRP01_39820 [Flavilitoribacter nigricans DSM 23189 = NBRC 102662]
MNVRNWLIVGIACNLIFLVSCEKWDLPPVDIPEVITGKFEAATIPSEGKLYGSINGLLDNGFVENHGHVWSLIDRPEPTVEQNEGQSLFGKRGNESFQSPVTDLLHGQIYQYRTYVLHNNQVKYGEIEQFQTALLSPDLKIDSITKKDKASTATIYTSFSGLLEGLPVTSFGITWKEGSPPNVVTDFTIAEQDIVISESEFNYSKTIQLPLGVTYVRPFLQAGGHIYYGEQQIIRTEDTWLQKSDFGGRPAEAAIAFAINGKGYVGSGRVQFSGERYTSEFWQYDPDEEVWIQKADIPGTPRGYAVSFVVKGRAYVGTGLFTGNVPSRDLWEYDPATNQWTRKAHFPGGQRTFAAGFTIGDKGYLGTGSKDYFNGTPQADFWEYDPVDDKWTRKADYPGAARSNIKTFSLEQKGYFVGGSNRSFNEAISKELWEYDQTSDRWERKADIEDEIASWSAAFSIGSKGYILGYDSYFWEYAPLKDQWIRKADYNGGFRRDPTGFAVGSKGYIVGGYDGSFRKDFRVYQSEK